MKQTKRKSRKTKTFFEKINKIDKLKLYRWGRGAMLPISGRESDIITNVKRI